MAMTPGFPDPFDEIRRYLSRAAARALDRAIAEVQQAAVRAVRRKVRDVSDTIDYVTSVLGRMPHGAANAVADAGRGPSARPLVPNEIALITQAFGAQPVSPGQVRIVPGAGRQPAAAAAFRNGNPAITIGNTIYIKPDAYRARGGSDLTSNPEGVEMLLHEYTHVIQYTRLGFTAFGTRYAREFHQSGYDAGKMYDYGSRKLNYDDEMLEGQAAMVGDYGRQMALPPGSQTPALIQELRTKLRGTGILGQ
ncbi:eCIS core domain-containing protein [Sphingomonas sp.]|uniref:eCIS core domain-containing protein n=1 Tax=Sphingomonas sp. TaxID=28214 RepID=UPI003D6CCA8C